MKILTTREELIKNYGEDRCLCVGYCELENILTGAGLKPFAYTKGVCGWNYDYRGILITTGCRDMIGKRAINCEEYEKRALKIENRYPYPEDAERRKKAYIRLLEKFIKENFNN